MDIEKYKAIANEINPFGVKIVAISKAHSVEDILELYNQGQRIFGENKVQELVSKYIALPKDIEWHFVGHLQTNKVKLIAPFVSMIQSVDSLKLLAEINKQGEKNQRVIDCLLQIYIAEEETKFGLNSTEVKQLLMNPEFSRMKNVRVCGLMGMATNTENAAQIENEFKHLASLFTELKTAFFSNSAHFTEISMGMSSDYKIALRCGTTLIRLGSIIFGERQPIAKNTSRF